MREIVINAVGADRPGIVAALTRVLHDVGGNLTDCRAALLRGSFAAVLAVTVPDDVANVDLDRRLRPVGESLGMGIWIGDAAPAPTGPRRDRCVVSVYGADHPGILSAVTGTLADAGVNVVDLSSRVVGDPPIYVVGIEAELPEGLVSADLDRLLEPVGAAQRVEVSVSTVDDEVM